MLFDGQSGETILFTLPEVPLPEAAAGVRIGGPVSAEGMLSAFYDGLRLATLLVCVGAANALANPKRLLASLPGALYELGVTITVALSIAPQLVESAQRVHRARRLRGEVGRRTRLFREVAVPVMTDALDRSLLLAASMDARGYGRHGGAPACWCWAGSWGCASVSTGCSTPPPHGRSDCRCWPWVWRSPAPASCWAVDACNAAATAPTRGWAPSGVSRSAV
jgi:hypothetical protein